ncbi:MAG: lysophospholipid acyltransferase family protein [Ignavibacteriae bacterium]|nr:lysophospholipid acyltransferase family protein [Ignavibacteriota bacterium]
MQFRKVKKKFLQKLGNVLIVPSIIVLCKTLRITVKNKADLEKLLLNQNVIFAFWHGLMLAPWYVLRKYQPSTIISSSKDGKLLTKILHFWKYRVNRGSSSKGGKEVLDQLIIDAQNRLNIAITPDGPRGPKEQMKAGTVVIAKKTGIPIILLSVYYKSKITLKSWDLFQIPLPFSKVCIEYSEPIFIDKNLSYEETDLKINEVRKIFIDFQKRAEQNCYS